MNIFLAVIHPTEDQRASIKAALRDAVSIYESLDPRTIGSRIFGSGDLLLGWVSSSQHASGPRQYVQQDSAGATLFTGLPIDPEERVVAHRASELGEKWEEVAGRLEGIHSLVKATDSPVGFELQTDLFGYEHVFYRHYGDSWVFSNSVALVEKLTTRCALDSNAIASFVSIGRMAGDYTLLSDIKTVPPVTRVSWNNGIGGVSFRQTENLRDHFEKPRARLSQETTRNLASELQTTLRILDRYFSPLDCPLTGGRDSRVIFSLLAAGEIPANYYTHGQFRGEDAQIAAQIAGIKGLSHDFRESSEDVLLSRWDELVTAAVRRADGMYPLQHIAALHSATDCYDGHLSVRISGSGGSISRGAGQPHYFTQSVKTGDGVKAYFGQLLTRSRDGLVLPQGAEAVCRIVEERFAEYIDQGIPVANLPEVSSAYELTGRTDGGNMRATADLRDTFSPFCTRAFQRASALLSPRARLTSPIHRALVESLAPDLMHVPFDRKNPTWGPKQAWPILMKGTYSRYQRRIRRKLFRRQRDSVNFIVKNDMFDRSGWLERRLDHIRQRILDREGSPMWDVIDRRRVERLMSPDLEARERLSAMRGLYHVWTIAEYEHAR